MMLAFQSGWRTRRRASKLTALVLAGALAGVGCRTTDEPERASATQELSEEEQEAWQEEMLQPSPEEKVLTVFKSRNDLMIEAGERARKEGRSELVKNFGERLVKDHRFASRKISALARLRQLHLEPARLKTEKKETEDQSEAKRRKSENQKSENSSKDSATEEQGGGEAFQQLAESEDFDRLFLEWVDTHHREAIRELSKAAAELDDSEVRELVESFVPILSQHLALAQQLRKSASKDQ